MACGHPSSRQGCHLTFPLRPDAPGVSFLIAMAVMLDYSPTLMASF